MIAAQALVHRATLITFNPDDFPPRCLVSRRWLGHWEPGNRGREQGDAKLGLLVIPADVEGFRMFACARYSLLPLR